MSEVSSAGSEEDFVVRPVCRVTSLTEAFKTLETLESLNLLAWLRADLLVSVRAR
jgi:hypothetical protein